MSAPSSSTEAQEMVSNALSFMPNVITKGRQSLYSRMSAAAGSVAIPASHGTLRGTDGKTKTLSCSA
jgi:hypothetical protein